MNFAERLIKLRRENNLSQEELAEKNGVSRQSVSNWESVIVSPDIEKVLALSRLFGVTTDYLIDNEQQPSKVLNEVIVTDKAETVEPVENEDINEKDADITVPEETAEDEKKTVQEDRPEQQRPKSKWKTIKIHRRGIAIAVAVCLLIAAILPCPLGLYKKAYYHLTEDPVEYPYVLVHGLGGWGSSTGINDLAPYWGADSGDLAEYYDGQGRTVLEASVGPVSSTWDRACELYAQLTGTRVDYGEAHSEQNGHERYGRTYSQPLFAGWGTETPGGQLNKINLVGHNFGGNTVRLLTWLMANGSEEEKNASGSEASSLFTGGKADWVHSVTTLCAPLNGSTLYYCVDKLNFVDVLLTGFYAISGISSLTGADEFYDFHLEQFGVTDELKLSDALPDAFINGTDNAAYGLSPDGCAEFNKEVGTVDGVYYFSYSYLTTSKSSLTGNQVPNLTSTLLVLQPTAVLIGKYTDPDNSNYIIDESWLPNDGLVNVVSAQYPIGAEHIDFDSDSIKPGIWNVMPTSNGHHGTVIGMGQSAENTHGFYNSHFEMVDGLKRK